MPPPAREGGASRVQLDCRRVVVAERAAGQARRSIRARAASYGASSCLPDLARRGEAKTARLGASPPASSSAPPRLRGLRAEHPSRGRRRSRRARGRHRARRVDVADREHDLDAGGQEPRALPGARPSRPAPGGSWSPPRSALRPGPVAAARGPAAARARAGSPSPVCLLRRRRTRPERGGPRPAGSAPSPAAARVLASAGSARPPDAPPPARRPVRRASCMISARCTRQRPVKATISGWRVAPIDSAARPLLRPTRARRPPGSPGSPRSRRSRLTIGESSPVVARPSPRRAAAGPRRARPAITSMSPCVWAARANRSESPKRSPIAAASPAVAAAVSAIAARLLLEHGRQHEVAALDPVAAHGDRSAAGPARSQPPARPHLAMAGEVDADPERAAERRPAHPPRPGARDARARAIAVLGLSADHVGAAGQQLEVVGSERRSPVGL